MLIKNILLRIKNKIFDSSPIYRYISKSDYLQLKTLKRYQHYNFQFLGRPFAIVDSVTFLSSVQEIFIDEIYKFKSRSECPVIIDCGANIGLATLYFKLQYPNADLIAFEPDPNIFKALTENVRAFDFYDIRTAQNAISISDEFLTFKLEGGHSGMLVDDSKESGETHTVKAVRLKSLLQQYAHVDFLKIDIEGHESQLIPDIAEELKRVDFLFLEYHSFLNEQQSLGNILNHIQDAGLKYYIREAFHKQFPFTQREIFLNIDFMCNIFCYRE